jgi:glycosyltransferase involved in cell wall biosynthesis
MNPKILIFIDWFYPAFKAGGPIKSVYNLVENLKSEFDFFVVTGDRDIDGTLINVPMWKYNNVAIEVSAPLELNQWIEKDGYKVIYLSQKRQKSSVYEKIAMEIQPDWAYFNSLFSKNFTLKPYRALKKLGLKQMIAPRGMLGEGALSIKPLKKKVFLAGAKKLLFDKDTYWHATSQQEASEIRNQIGASDEQIRIASNLASPLAEDFNPSTGSGRRMIRLEDSKMKLFFLSRISKKKNLLFILKILNDLPELENLTLDIYGPIENDGHWEQCKPLVENDDRINYQGEIHPQAIPEMISNYHFLVLPTLHENYGHVIAETLSQGRPVLISDQSPWRDLEAKNIGHDLPLETEIWKEKLTIHYQLSNIHFQKMCNSAFSYAKRNIVNSSLIEASKALFAINEKGRSF